MEKKIVRRTYSVLYGKQSARVEYALRLPYTNWDEENFTPILEDAHLFKPSDCKLPNKTESGSWESGDYAFVQEVLPVNVEFAN